MVRVVRMRVVELTLLLALTLPLGVHAQGVVTVQPSTVEPSAEELIQETQVLYRIEPEARGGEAYKLVYLVPAPIAVFWRFKTDFNNDFLLTNKFIKEHRFISQQGDIVITEDAYTNAPDKVFRWRTTIYPPQHRLEFVLDNPRECNQRFHYGFIQVEPFGQQTKVTHVAYFDFFGASLWANYPWPGGMSSCLQYTAQWEQETIIRLGGKYGEHP